MSPHASSSSSSSSSLPAAPPNSWTLQRLMQEKSNPTHSQKLLQHLTKVAVQRAYKLLAESRCLAAPTIVDTQSCGYMKRLGCFSFSLLEDSPCPAPPSVSAKDWALSMDSNGRPRSVAARIHTLLTQWRADSSVEWRARVASVVPVFEEVLHKQAMSVEELTIPQLLESHLLCVLCHFEAGNGPFLLQGSSPLYPAHKCHHPSSPSDRISPLFSRASAQSASENKATHDNASMNTIVTASRLTSPQSFASSSSPILTETICSRPKSIDTVQNVCNTEELSTNKHAEHASSKIAKRVASVFTEKRSDKSVCFKEGRGSAGCAAEVVQRVDKDSGRVETMSDPMLCDISPSNTCHSDRRMRRTLGGMLELNMFQTHVPPSVLTPMSPPPPPPPSTLVSPSCRAIFSSPSSSSAPPTSASAPSRSRITPPHQAAFSIPPPLHLSSSSPSQEPTHASNARVTPLSSSLSRRRCAPLPTSPDKPSLDLNHLICESGVQHDHNTANMFLHAGQQAVEAAALITLDHPMIHPAPDAPRAIEIGESSSGPSMTSSPLANNEEASKAREKGMKLPLRSFLADREGYMGYLSRYEEGGPSDTWEEATEELGGMCCVCMVGFKGAAFVPCGHTFCRKCTRQLWRGRGTCPLCNRCIRDILDIY